MQVPWQFDPKDKGIQIAYLHGPQKANKCTRLLRVHKEQSYRILKDAKREKIHKEGSHKILKDATDK